MKKSRGFTLIELMIGIAIIGVLVAIAYPQYTKSLVKGNRANAKAFLLEVAQKEQQFLLDTRNYATEDELKAAGLKEPPEFSRFYTLDVVPDNVGLRKFTARATPIPGTRQDGDGWLEIDETGAKTAEGGKTDKW